MRPSGNGTDTESRSIIYVTTVAASISVVTAFIITLFLIVCGLILTKLFRSKSVKDSTSSNANPRPPDASDVQVIPVYESVFPMEFQEEDVKLNNNIAYGPLPAVI